MLDQGDFGEMKKCVLGNFPGSVSFLRVGILVLLTPSLCMLLTPPCTCALYTTDLCTACYILLIPV